MKSLNNLTKKEASPNLAGRGEASERVVKKTPVSNLAFTRQKNKCFVVIRYVDTSGAEQVKKLSGNMALMLICCWEARVQGITNKDIYAGMTLRDYVYRMSDAPCSTYKMNFKRVPEQNQGKSPHKRYYLLTPIAFLDEQGFPEIQRYIEVR